MTGVTEKGKDGDGPVVHFFAHPDGAPEGQFLLPWPVPQGGRQQQLPSEYSLPPGSYMRIGRTPVIARDGWKAYRLPRFTTVSPPEKQCSIYGQAPRDSYRAWQEPSRALMKLGHWRYGDHHDLLTLNLMLAFDTELDRISLNVGGSLARYVFKNMFLIFGIRREDLTNAGQRIWDTMENDTYCCLLPNKLGNTKSLLVYPSHVVTDHIMDRFLGLISDSEVLQKVNEQTIGILPVRCHRTGSTMQISGLTLERLQKEVNQRKSVPSVVLFDDAVITGRTHEELKRLLRSKGFKSIYTLTILDRQRLPSADYINTKKNACYWRFDVPPMGSDAHCPLCSALEKARDLAEALTSPLTQNRILQSWIPTWSPHNPASEWGDAGLKPILLELKNPKHRFGIMPDPSKPGVYLQCGGEEQCIRITNSSGLVAWVTEMHSMTSRDDFPEKLLNEEDLVRFPEVRIQLLASQLLMFAGEFDFSLEKKLTRELLKALWETKKHDRHTALAVLTLLATSEKSLTLAMDELLTPENKKDVGYKHVDFILLLVHCIRSTLIPDEPNFEKASRLLRPTDRIGIYFNLHREIKDVQGKCHSSPLHRIYRSNDLGNGVPDSLEDVEASIGHILALSELISRAWLRVPKGEHPGGPNKADSLSLLKQSCQHTQYTLIELRKHFDQNHMKKIQDAVNHLLSCASAIHENLFLALGIPGMKNGSSCQIIKELRRLSPDDDLENLQWIDSNGYASQCQVKALEKETLEEAYVVWDWDVVDAMEHVLTNVRHAEGQKIPIPKDWGNFSEQSVGWGRVTLEEHHLAIELANHSNDPPGKIDKDTEYTTWRLSLGSLGGKIDYKKNEQGALVTSIYLPYAHTLSPGQRDRRD